MEKLNEKYCKTIKELEEKFETEKNRNIKLQNEINTLKKLVNEKEEMITREKENKTDLMKAFEDLKKQFAQINNAKDDEIKKLKSSEEKLMTLIVISNDEIVHYSFICKNTYKFTKIEEMIYEKYPEYKKRENSFVVIGKKINRNKTLEENKIKNSDIITLISKYN